MDNGVTCTIKMYPSQRSDGDLGLARVPGYQS